MNSAYTYGHYDHYGFVEQSAYDSDEAISFPLKTLRGNKYDMDGGHGFVPDNYGNDYDHYDQEYGDDDKGSGEDYNYGHENLAEKSMRKLKELKRRKYNENYNYDDEKGEHGDHDEDTKHEYDKPYGEEEEPTATTPAPTEMPMSFQLGDEQEPGSGSEPDGETRSGSGDDRRPRSDHGPE
ncbi:unnamed protein product [Schistosoma turkestanicum]|nr:unnamed protein product [Schistosoma turkestanicum]